MLQIMNMKPMFVSLGLSLALCVACGGSDGANGSTAGAGGSSSSSGGSGSGGSGNPAGSAGTSQSASGAANVPTDKQIGSWTDAEWAAECDRLNARFSDGSALSKNLEEFACRSGSALLALIGNPATDAELQAACKSAYDMCVASPAMTSSTCKKPGASCTATLAEYDACLNDYLKSLGEVLKTFPSCDKLTMASLSTIFTPAQPPASCQTLQAKCPDVELPGQGSEEEP